MRRAGIATVLVIALVLLVCAVMSDAPDTELDPPRSATLADSGDPPPKPEPRVRVSSENNDGDAAPPASGEGA